MNLTKSVVAEFVDLEPKLSILELELPPVGPNWVLIKVCACALSAPEEERSRRQLLKEVGDELVYVGQDVAGVVKAVGKDVCSVQIGDRVVGIVPLDYRQSGCSTYVVLQEFDIVPIPDGVSFVEAAASIGDAVKVYTALHYLGRLNSGDTVLLLGGRTSFASIFVQLANHWSARVIAAIKSSSQNHHFSSLNLSSVQIIDAESKGLKRKIMMETGELGADIIVNQMAANKGNNPSLHEIISCLAVGGRFVTSDPQTQLDPPQSRQLLLRCGSVGYLFEQAWVLSSAQQGRYQHILMDIMEKVATKTLKPFIEKTVTKLDDACETLKLLQAHEDQGRVVVSLS